LFLDDFHEPGQRRGREVTMHNTVTLQLDDNIYKMFRIFAESENRTIANFIQTSVLQFIEDNKSVDEYEMAEINGNQELNTSIKNAFEDVKANRGRFVE